MSGELPEPADAPSETLLAEIERAAVDLARLAGTEIQASLGRILSVRYKADGDAETLFRDPVSEVDHRAETLIRSRLAELFPAHGIIGEELDEKPGGTEGFVWAVDPIDGTTNFVNGFPLFAACIGVLHRGAPVVGAIWCSTSHALRPGVYHARAGGPLAFDEQTLDRPVNPEVRRRLVGEPHAPSSHDPRWDVRKTGSAAIECAFVAAGLLHAARFESPHVWDVASGVAIVRAAGRTVLAQQGDGWRPFTNFVEGAQDGNPRHWSQPMILGDAAAAREMGEARTSRAGAGG